MKFFIAFINLLLICLNSTSADILDVPINFTTIQQAIDSCNSGDTILVAPGEYRESLVMRRKSIVFASHYILQADSNKIDSTVLKSSNGTIFNADSCVDSMIIIGFKIEGSDGDQGGAVYAYNTKVNIRNNYFYFSGAGGWRTGRGGAIYALESDLYIAENRFEYCSADYGGAVYANNSVTVIKNNFFRYNHAQEEGGALRMGACKVNIENNTFTQNWGFRSGGAILCGNSEGFIRNNIILENIYVDLDSAGSDYGGGISCSGPNAGTATLRILDNLIEKNTAYSGGGGLTTGNNVLVQNNLIIANKDGLGSAIYVTGDTRIVNNTIYGNSGYSTIYIKSGGPEITNNIIWENKLSNEWKTIFKEPSPGIPVVTYNDIQDGYNDPSNFNSDPLFRNILANDFHLKTTACGDNSDSPCIDSGSPFYTDSLLYCGAGLGSSLSDIGAYGGGIGAPTTLQNEPDIYPGEFELIKVFPNPFNGQVKIELSIDQPKNISVSIYSLDGSTIRILYKGQMIAGKKVLLWDGRNEQGITVSSNVYFVQIALDAKIYFKKLLLIK
ncbi:MAG: right-handed parallel beta-helix repeat-containing protein [Flavobacteriales bacterium]|nr:right-handed parallel beta-helix repeat-containing protein [Flavobacteriales bacterium]